MSRKKSKMNHSSVKTGPDHVTSKRESEYGEDYKEHLLEEYKLYVEMADNVSQRRADINQLFITAHTSLLAIVILFSGDNILAQFAVSITGIICAISWHSLIVSYRELNTAKFEVIQDIEKQLPYSPYKVEWDKLVANRGKEKKKYLTQTQVENFFTLTFGLVYYCMLLYAIWSLDFG